MLPKKYYFVFVSLFVSRLWLRIDKEAKVGQPMVKHTIWNDDVTDVWRESLPSIRIDTVSVKRHSRQSRIDEDDSREASDLMCSSESDKGEDPESDITMISRMKMQVY